MMRIGSFSMLKKFGTPVPLREQVLLLVGKDLAIDVLMKRGWLMTNMCSLSMRNQQTTTLSVVTEPENC